jgi:glycosyltransferase involved in cell wall biosynthesis
MRIRTSFLQRVPGIDRLYRYVLPVMPRAIESLSIPGHVDMVVSLSHAVAKSIVPPPGVPHVCYCFTPMRYAWHLRGHYFGEESESQRSWFRHGLRAPVRFARDAVLDRICDWDRATSDRVTHFVAISETIRQRIADCYQRDSTVVYPPVDTQFHTPAAIERDTFYLCVSALVPYKRIDLAIEACNRLRRKLIIIGTGPQETWLRALAGPTVTLLGWRDDETVRDHFRKCRAVLFPGLEDFGLVPVEAQACGAPVIAYDSGGARETIVPASRKQVGSGVFFSEQSVDSLCEAIEWFERYSGQCCEHTARRNALRFDTPRFERQLFSLLHEIHATSHGDVSTARRTRRLAA